MRLIAFALTAALATAISADEPRRNPFRDGSPLPTQPQPPKPDPVKNGPKALKPAEAGVGRLVPDVAFADIAGKSGKLSDFRTSKALVVIFTDTGCPLCKKYAPTLARLEKELGPKGVAFLFVNPTASETADDIRKAIADHGLQGPYVHDRDGKLTAALGAKSTTEAFVLDAARTVVYRGAVDDQYGLGYSLDAPRTHYLTTALNELLTGQSPVVSATTAPGCVLDAKPAAAVDVTYHGRISRIVQANCGECHRKEGVAPFALDTYEQVVARKGMLRRVVDAGTMPPWFATPPAKGEHSPWLNDQSLSADDKAALLAWLSGDLKAGDPADAPLPRSYASGWKIGKPDAIFQIPKPFAVKAQGTMPYQKATIETTFDEDRWVQAMEVQPTAREVVHHVLVHAIPRGGQLAAALNGEHPQGFFAIYVPGNSSLIYPEGYAKKLPKGTLLRFEIHYTPNGKATTDQTRVGFVFAKEKPRYEVKVHGIANERFEIPPGADNYQVNASIPSLPAGVKLLAFAPHMHLRGKAARYEVKLPDGSTKVLLDVPHYDFNWQLLYRFAEPVALPAGSRLNYLGWFDNSSGNPANPDPTKAVHWGQQTYDEMHLGYVEYVVDRSSAVTTAPQTGVKIPKGGVVIPPSAKAEYQKYDTNGDGKLDEKEIEALPDDLKLKALAYIRRTMK